MSGYDRREVVTRVIEYSIPSGSAMAELEKVISRAELEYRREIKGESFGGGLSDDWCRIHARDDEVVITFQCGKTIKGTDA
jgi:hypothetical protein